MPQLLFIKPRDSQRFFQAFGRKAFWPDSDADLEKKLELAAREGADVVLQEYVPGPPANHVFVDGFVDSSGRTKARFARRRLRMFPRRFGNSSYMVSVPLTEVTDAVEVVDAILQESDYRGIFSAELKKDENDGAFKVLEVNIRPWWFVEFAATCGVNVAAMAYHDALGNHVGEVSTYRVGRRMSHPYYDWFACRSESSGFPGALLKWCGSLAGARQPVFSWDDPMPALAEFGALARSFVRRRLGRVLHR